MIDGAVKLFVVGAGAFGREVFEYAHEAGRLHTGERIQLAGFVDDRFDPREDFFMGGPMVSNVEHAPIAENHRFVIAVGDPLARFQLAQRLKSRGARLGTVVHPQTKVCASARLGEGCVLAPFVFVGQNTQLSPNVVLNISSTVGHDAKVGAHAVLSPHAVLNGGVELGEGVFLGTHAGATPNVKIGRWSKMAAGSIASRDCGECMLLVGNPAAGRVMYRVPAPVRLSEVEASVDRTLSEAEG